jgi:hypothetical protein
MASLGSFGVEKQVEAEPVPEEEELDQGVEPLTFTWFGAEIQLTDEYDELQLVDLMESARYVDQEDPMALVVVKDTLRLLIHEDSFNTFWRLARQNKQRIEDLAALVQQLVTAVTDRPTQRPSDSSVGRSRTEESSPVASPTQVSRGRPDIQNLIDSGEEDKKKIQALIKAV